jgi:hypothetical protein
MLRARHGAAGRRVDDQRLRALRADVEDRGTAGPRSCGAAHAEQVFDEQLVEPFVAEPALADGVGVDRQRLELLRLFARVALGQQRVDDVVALAPRAGP